MVILCSAWLVLLAAGSLWAQSEPQKPAPPTEKKSEQPAPAAKHKWKKVNTLFGVKWVDELTGETVTTPPAPEAEAPAQNPPVPAHAAPPQTPKPEPAREGKKEKATAAAPTVAATLAEKPGAEQSATEKPAGEKSPTEKPGAEKAPPPPALSSASLVFNNADLVQVIQVIAKLLHLNYVLDPRVKGSVTVSTMGDISNADLMQILQSLLRINGAAAVESGNIWQIVPMKDAIQIPTPLEAPGGRPLAPDDTLVTEIVPMHFVTSADMAKILKEFMSDAGSIVSEDRGNILILTDASRNMARLLDLIQTFDSDALANSRIRLFSVKNNSARALVEDLKSIFSAYGMSDKDSAVHFVAIDRLNAILAVAPAPSSLDVVAQWITKLDEPAQVSGLRNYVYHVQYAKAKDLRDLLASLYGSVITGGAGEQRPENTPASLAAASSASGLAPSTILSQAHRTEATAPPQRETYGFQGQIRVVADEVNNLLIVQSTPQDYDLIEQTLRQIDVMPRQVLIQAQIFTVDLSHDFSLGVEYSLQQRGTAGAGSTTPIASFGGGTAGGNPLFSGSAVIMNAGARELFAQITSSENRSRTKTLSSPSILATDNKEARIQVGVSIPTLTSSGFNSTSSNTLVNTIQNVDTGVILSVTPHISASGLVGMTISQEVSSPVPPPAGVTNISPSINKSSASTSFVVHDGDTVAIAGIITENKSLTRNRIPLLGDIPILGAAFGTTTTSSKRSELIIFITPHVINTLDQQGVVSEALKEQMRKLKKDLRSSDKNYHRVWDQVPTLPAPK